MRLYVSFTSDGVAVASTTPPAEPAWEVCIHGEPTVENIWSAVGAAAENGGGNEVTRLARTIALYRAVVRQITGDEPEPEIPVPVSWLWENEKRVLLSVLPREWEIRQRVQETAGLIPDRSLLCHTSRSGAQGLRTFGPINSPRPWTGFEVVPTGPHYLVKWSNGWTGAIIAPTAQRGRWWRDAIEPALRRWAQLNEIPVVCYDRNGDWVIFVPFERARGLTQFLKSVKMYRLAVARGADVSKYRIFDEEDAMAIGVAGENGYHV